MPYELPEDLAGLLTPPGEYDEEVERQVYMTHCDNVAAIMTASIEANPANVGNMTIMEDRLRLYLAVVGLGADGAGST